MKAITQKLMLLALLLSLAPLAAADKKRPAGTVADPVVISDSDSSDDETTTVALPAPKRRAALPLAAATAPAVEEDECAYCLEPMDNADDLRTLPCLHKMHIACSALYEKHHPEVKPPCPLCETPFSRTVLSEAAAAYPAPYAEPAAPHRGFVAKVQIPMPDGAGDRTKQEIIAAIKNNRVNEPIMYLGGQTALSYACNEMHVAMVAFLLDTAHANPSAKDFSGKTPLQLMVHLPDTAATQTIKAKLRAAKEQHAVEQPAAAAEDPADNCTIQ